MADRDKIRELIHVTTKTAGTVRELGSNFGFALGNLDDPRATAAAYGDAVGVPRSDFTGPERAFIQGLGRDERIATDPSLPARWVIERTGRCSF